MSESYTNGERAVAAETGMAAAVLADRLERLRCHVCGVSFETIAERECGHCRPVREALDELRATLRGAI